MAGKFKEFINSIVNVDDEYEDDDIEEFEPDIEGLDYSEDYSSKPRFAKTTETKASSYGEEEMGSAAPRRVFRNTRKSNVVSMNPTMEVCMIKPVDMDDAKEISDILTSGRAVVINMEGLNIDIAQRLIDFSSGACYATEGKLQAISRSIFIISPKNIELSGDFSGSIFGGSDTVKVNI